MPQAPNLSIQNNFIAGLKTQYTGLNFPENAATDSQNVIYDLVGNIYRRPGMDYETNFHTDTINRTGLAINTYKWNNVGGDGLTQIVVKQVGSILYFYVSSSATIAAPLSTQLLAATVSISTFTGSGATFSAAAECQFSDGNGYLFVFHPNCDPFYCTFIPGTPATVDAAKIDVKIRDLIGVQELGQSSFNNRPTTLTSDHKYNLQNQGWTSGTPWSTTSTTQVFTASGGAINVAGGNQTFIVSSASGIAVGQQVTLSCGGTLNYVNGGVSYTQGFGFSGLGGNVVSISGVTLVVNITSGTGTVYTVPGSIALFGTFSWTITQTNQVATLNTFAAGVGTFPSNADVWYAFKNTSDVFSPATTVGNVSLPSSPAPKGFYILNAFNQNRTATSGISGLTVVSTTSRPKTGCWFQGRVWYTGVDASQRATGDQAYYTWTENLYFSQIIESPTEFGFCYQEEDPTDEDLSDVLPTDGGVITIQGSGSIDQLFPVQNGLIVFAANGIWFITGSQGIGFSATDYTITRISGIQSISANSYVNVMGYPVFWNEEGIYSVTPGSNGILQVENLALDSILDFYADIPLQSKKFARGDYNPIDYEIQWCFRSTNESSVTDRYQFDRILVHNVKNKSFYYHTVSNGATAPWIHDIRYVAGPGGSTSPEPALKYLTSVINGATYNFTFSELQDDTNYVDWHTHGDSLNFTSYFVAGYNLHGKSFARWQPVYVYLYLNNSVQNAYKIQGLWDYAINAASGRWSTVQQVIDNTSTANFGMKIRRHKIRGQGIVFQLKVQSVDGKPFDVMGWSMFEQVNQGV